MPFPTGISPLRSKVRFATRPSVITTLTKNGTPWIREMSQPANGKMNISAPYLMTDAQRDQVIADFESQPGSFSWDDDRYSTPVSRTVQYDGPPISRKTMGGVPLPADQNFVVVNLIEV